MVEGKFEVARVFGRADKGIDLGGSYVISGFELDLNIVMWEDTFSNQQDDKTKTVQSPVGRM